MASSDPFPKSTSTAWSKSPWTTHAQCNRAPTGCGDIGGILLDGKVIRLRVHSVFVTDNANTKVPPRDLDTMLPVRFNVWTVKATNAWKRTTKPSDGQEVDPTDRTYIKRRKAGDPDPDSLKLSFADVAKTISHDPSGNSALPTGYIADKAVHASLHPTEAGCFEFWANVSNDSWKAVVEGEELRIRTLGGSCFCEHVDRLNAKTVFGKGGSEESEQVAAGWGNKLLAHAENDVSSDDDREGAGSDEWD